MNRSTLALALALAVAGGAPTVASASSRHGEHHRDRDHDDDRDDDGDDDDEDEADRPQDRRAHRGDDGASAHLERGARDAAAEPAGRERLVRANLRGPEIDATYAKECGSCHLAYPPRMLPAESWKKLMTGLEHHFGQNAEVEPEVRAGVEGWLVENAGRPPRRGDPAPLRITERRWFQGEHRKAARAAAGNSSIRSVANCAACHPGAERWDFEEDRVRIPRDQR